jgi:glycosyltransferase involved in cell wall biosynthesis
MSRPLDLSVIVPCYNESHNIRDCLVLLQEADEVILVDSYSTDDTLGRAKGLYTKLLQRDYDNSASQKNWAIPQAKHSWVLIVDADERVPVDLWMEIRQILSNPKAEAYRMLRRNFLYGKRVCWGSWRNDSVVRLFRRDLCRYEDKFVHAELQVSGRVILCTQYLEHYSHRGVGDFLKKAAKYSDWGSKNLEAKGVQVGCTRLAFQPVFHFLKSYFLKLGFLDGSRGLVISFFEAFHSFLKYAKRMEKCSTNDTSKASSSSK